MLPLLPLPGGLRCSPEELRPAADAVLSQRPPDTFTAQSIAIAVHLQGDAGVAWLRELCEREPARALAGVLELVKLGFTYSPEYKVCLVQSRANDEGVPLEVYQALRRGFDRAGGREQSQLPELSLPTRAGLAWVFPERHLWTAELTTEVLDTGVFRGDRRYLFAALADRPAVAEQPLDPVTSSEELLVLSGHPDAVARNDARVKLAKECAALAAVLGKHEVSRFSVGSFGSPFALGPQPERAVVLERVIEQKAWPEAASFWRALLDLWRPVASSAKEVKWPSLLSKRAALPAPPGAAPDFPGLGGRWEAAHPGQEPLDPEQRLDTEDFAEAVRDHGAGGLAAARELTRSKPYLLAGLAEIDDLGLAESWVAVAASPIGRRALDVAGFIRTNPALAAAAACRLFFEPDPGAHQGARLALRLVEAADSAAAATVLARLSAEQRAFVDAMRAPPPIKKSKLPSFVDVSQLPFVELRDGAGQLSAETRTELLIALRATPAQAAGDLRAFTDQLDPASLRRFIGALASTWLLSGAPSKERWAVDALALVADDAWATALGALADAYAGWQYTVSQSLIGALAQCTERAALAWLFKLSKSRTGAVRKAAEVALSQSAGTLGLSRDELADLMVPGVVPAGFVPGKKPPAKASAEEKSQWKAASTAAADALKRAEKMMVDGRTITALSFVETWRLKPVLAPLTAKLVWGVYRDGARVGLSCGEHRAGEVAFDERLRVRPVHPLELTAAEREQVSQWVTPREQPFPQLERQTFGEGDAPALQRLVGAEVTRGKLMALVAEGWRWIRGERLDGIERRGAGWRVELHIEPPFFPGGGVDDPDSSITAVNLGGGGMPPVLRSELQLQLTRSFG